MQPPFSVARSVAAKGYASILSLSHRNPVRLSEHATSDALAELTVGVRRDRPAVRSGRSPGLLPEPLGFVGAAGSVAGAVRMSSCAGQPAIVDDQILLAASLRLNLCCCTLLRHCSLLSSRRYSTAPWGAKANQLVSIKNCLGRFRKLLTAHIQSRPDRRCRFISAYL